jgi:hypothetical protein
MPDQRKLETRALPKPSSATQLVLNLKLLEGVPMYKLTREGVGVDAFHVAGMIFHEATFHAGQGNRKQLTIMDWTLPHPQLGGVNPEEMGLMSKIETSPKATTASLESHDCCGAPPSPLLKGRSAMLVFYELEDRSPWFILAFAGACALGSVYGFLQGAWPFGVIEAVWTS